MTSRNVVINSKPHISLPEPAVPDSPRSISELNAAAVKLQKVYKSYRTRRNLAECAVVVEELWRKALESAARKRRSEALRRFVSQDLTSDKPANNDHSKDGRDFNDHSKDGRDLTSENPVNNDHSKDGGVDTTTTS